MKKLPTPTFKNHQIFDPWNSASTGHQRAENPYSNTTSWRTTRSEKLSRQFVSGDCSGNVTNTNSRTNANEGNGRGEWKWMDENELKRNQLGCRDIRSFMGGSKKRTIDEGTEKGGEKKEKKMKLAQENIPTTITNQVNDQVKEAQAQPLSGTTIYINGSTMPLISDHRLKQLLVANGATIAISLARRSVTHVIVGKPNGGPMGKGASGGLAATKLQSEIDRCNKGAKVVYVEWALESIKASKRLSEAKFTLNITPKGQQKVAAMFKK